MGAQGGRLCWVIEAQLWLSCSHNQSITSMCHGDLNNCVLCSAARVCLYLRACVLQ